VGGLRPDGVVGGAAAAEEGGAGLGVADAVGALARLLRRRLGSRCACLVRMLYVLLVCVVCECVYVCVCVRVCECVCVCERGLHNRGVRSSSKDGVVFKLPEGRKGQQHKHCIAKWRY